MFEKFFNPENMVFSFINKVADLVWLSILWLACSLPLFTLGASSSAMYYAVVKCVRKDLGSPTKEFFRSFKQNFWKGTAVSIFLLLLAAALLFADVPLLILFFESGTIQNKLLFAFFCLKVVVLVGAMCWLFPLLSRFEIKLLKLGESSLYLLLRYFYITIPAILLLAAAVYLMLVEPFLILLLPALVTLILTFLLEPVMEKLTDEDVTEEMEKTL